jgi:hypothetical protein
LLFAALLLLFAGDAAAWGLYTHVFLAQHVLLVLPLADANFRRAALRLPRLVLAGACLPDLSLPGLALRTLAFSRCHTWPTMRRFFAATCDEERAIAIGYASHLLADVVAHNHFVPEHEARMVNVPHATHALCEWAMDSYVRKTVLANPDELLDAERTALTAVVARHLRCPPAIVRTALLTLARGTQALHASRLPRLCRAIVWRLDHLAAPRFEVYMRETVARLAHLTDALAGIAPEADPEPIRVVAPRQPFSSTRLVQPSSLS